MRHAPVVVLLLVLAGCGGGQTSAVQTQTSPSTTVVTQTTATATPLELFFLADDGKLVAAQRNVPRTQAVAAAALVALSQATTMRTDVPHGLSVTIENANADVIGAPLSAAALAQVVYTLTEFPTVKSVNGKTRADVEDFVPAILVEQPTPNEEVTSPLRVTGNANTFEATFEYELKDAGGAVIAKGFTTATSGSGMRGTFDLTVPFQVADTQDGTLVVYESSAEDGSRIHIREIPLRLVA